MKVSLGNELRERLPVFGSTAYLWNRERKGTGLRAAPVAEPLPSEKERRDDESARNDPFALPEMTSGAARSEKDTP